MFHNVIEYNSFFKKVLDLHSGCLEKIFKIDNRKYCEEISENNSVYSIHNFLRHSEEGKTQPMGEKSLIQGRISDIKMCRISFHQHFDEHDFCY